MAISKPTTWGNIAGKPTTVASLGISDFAAQAIAAQANITAGAVGTYIIAVAYNVNVANGATVAGSSLRVSTTAPDLGNTVANAVPLSGTWRCITVNNVASNSSGFWQYGPALYMRIS